MKARIPLRLFAVVALLLIGPSHVLADVQDRAEAESQVASRNPPGLVRPGSRARGVEVRASAFILKCSIMGLLLD